jgi:peptidoglycan/xylan/chitin deacetylase (PgdA/CDA1 family)
MAQAVLDSLYYSNIYRLLESSYQGIGVIFTLHHVVKATDTSPFAINKLLEITPEFLEQTIQQVLMLGYDIISLDQLHQRIVNQQFGRRFVCFTLDDGYVDNYQQAFPIFKKYNVPFTIYVTTGLIDGSALLWWRCLEVIIQQTNTIELTMNGKPVSMLCHTLPQKQHVFEKLYWYLRNMPLTAQHALLAELCQQYGISTTELCLKYAMTWDMLKEIANHPLATIGVHTVNHLALGKLPEQQALDEMRLCQTRLQQELNIAANHFCYPYGDAASASEREFALVKSLGFKTATTTRKQVLTPDNIKQLDALPRIPLNGHYQRQRYIRVLLSGVPTGLWQSVKTSS